MHDAMDEEVNLTEENENIKTYSDENEGGTLTSIITCITQVAQCIGMSVSFDMRHK